ncbi:MAG TPA: M28 family peptidase, partial [Gemmataceae bacterium]|nr:M28 family peptidase [Gemmataceae bacterium]
MPHVGTNADPPKQRDQFADNPAVPATIRPAAFDGKRALGYIEELCKIGPRISGSDGMKKQQELIASHFKKLGAKVEFQKFASKQASQRAPVDMANMIITWHPDRERRVVLCSHYDTRPKADQEPNRGDWDKPFVSANDGTAGVAWLMELGNHIKQMPLTIGVDFVLFDGEEFVFEGPRGADKYFFGSEHFADEYRKDRHGKYYAAGILLDLCCGKDPKFPVEKNSWFEAAPLVREIWGTAKELQVGMFQDRIGDPVSDDHLALNAVRIPTVDIIDFDNYPHWHKLSDLPENCSAESMEQIAKV